MPIAKSPTNSTKVFTKCPHVVLIDKHLLEEKQLDELCNKNDLKCCVCSGTANLWICLRDDCKQTLCSSKPKQQSMETSSHKKQHVESKNHSIMYDLKAKSIFCDLCDEYIDLNHNQPSINDLSGDQLCDNSQFFDCMNKNLNVYINNDRRRGDENDEEDDDEDSFGLSSQREAISNEESNIRGLVGFVNLANTCYINSALQALSNCPSLTNFFLECQNYVNTDKQPSLAQPYMKLMHAVWSKTETNSSIAPRELVQVIKSVNPLFRGYTQQDSQEFLLCLLGHLHDELKRIQIGGAGGEDHEMVDQNGSADAESMNRSASQSDTDSYETCDSTPSSENNFLSNYETTLNGDGPTILFSSERHRSISSDSAENQDSGVHSSSKSENELILNPKNLENLKMKGKRKKKKKDKKIEEESMESINDVDTTEATTKAAATNSSSNKKDKKHYTSIISDIFDGKMISQVQCLKCDHISNTIETFQDLSLSIPTKEYLQALESKLMNRETHANASSKQYQTWRSWIMGFITGGFLWGPSIKLEDCLTVFFSEADLKGDNMYSCEKCKKLSDGIKYSKILKLPETLCIHLKRFRHDYMYSSKINTYIEFPLKDLNMSSFLHKNCKNKSSRYDLCAIICHHGGSNGGHYTCYAFNHIDNEWYEYDDSSCMRVDEATVKNAQAYVLFYRKKNAQMDAVANELNALLKQKLSKTRPFYLSKQWINKLKYFSEPGVISNHDFLCSHGAVYPELWSNVESLVIPVSEDIYNYLVERFGIDDSNVALNSLHPCKQCLIDSETLNQRRYYERTEFSRLYEDKKHIKETNMCYIVYMISANWIKEWELFLQAKLNDPPGPINNYSICSKNKNGTYDLNKNPNSHEINKLCWDFFYKIYGGGPVLIKNIHNKSYNPTAAKAIPTSASVTKTLSKSISLSASPPSSSIAAMSPNSSKSLLSMIASSDTNSSTLPSTSTISTQNIINFDPTSNENIIQVKQTRI